MKNLYLLVDGTHADPGECDVGADHELRHANGLAVALREDGTPQTVAQGAVENMNVEAAKAGESELAPPDDLLLTTDDVEAETDETKPAKAKKPAKPKNREIRTS